MLHGRQMYEKRGKWKKKEAEKLFFRPLFPVFSTEISPPAHDGIPARARRYLRPDAEISRRKRDRSLAAAHVAAAFAAAALDIVVGDAARHLLHAGL